VASSSERPHHPELPPTRPDQLWWPQEGIRKRDVYAYYGAIAPALLPHLRDRPFTIKRYPNGPRGPCFWIKDLPPEAPAWIRVAPLPARSRGGGEVRYALVPDRRTLLWLADFGCVDMHVWSARRDRPSRPDWAIFDLDPTKSGDTVEAALLLKQALDALDLESFPRTSGHPRGMHVLVPLARVHEHDEVRAFVQAVARAVHRSHPKLGVAVDAKMNGQGQQFVSAYSVRPKSARVCTPLRWDEVDESLGFGAFTMAEVLQRVDRLGDLHAGVLRGRQRLGPALRRFAAARRG
jgi:bifunctional non-homologous end joining protein LigD